MARKKDAPPPSAFEPDDDSTQHGESLAEDGTPGAPPPDNEEDE
jgi:hypothetical protein